MPRRTRSEWPLQALNVAQSSALSRIRCLHSQRQGVRASARGGPSQAATAERCNAVRSGGILASYKEDMVSLPTGSKQACHLRDILPGAWRELLDNFVDAMLLPQAERDALVDDSEISRPWYVDPV